MVTTYPPEVLDLTFRTSIEGSRYSRQTTYVAFEPPVEFRRQMMRLATQVAHGLQGWGNAPDLFSTDIPSPRSEWVVVQRNEQSYPSGGQSYYPSYAYWSGWKLEVAQRNGIILWSEVDFYEVVRAPEEAYLPYPVQQEQALENLTHWIELLDPTRFADLRDEYITMLAAMHAGTASNALWWHWLYR